MQYGFGVDIGGTTIKIGLFSVDGDLMEKWEIPTNKTDNGKYILVAEEYLPENFKTESIRVEYKKAAVIGNMLYPEVYEQQNGVTIVLADEQKVPYAIMQFRGK